MNRPVRNSHCSFCGARYPDGAPWPRVCAACGQTTYRNPLPVAVMLLPVDGGLLAVRRGIPPSVGVPALPGGYIEFGETWQAAAARELSEEAAVAIDPAEVRLFAVKSAPDGTVLIFGTTDTVRSSAGLPAFAPTPEAPERLVIPAPAELAFPLHTQAAAEWFAARPR